MLKYISLTISCCGNNRDHPEPFGGHGKYIRHWRSGGHSKYMTGGLRGTRAALVAVWLAFPAPCVTLEVDSTNACRAASAFRSWRDTSGSGGAAELSCATSLRVPCTSSPRGLCGATCNPFFLCVQWMNFFWKLSKWLLWAKCPPKILRFRLVSSPGVSCILAERPEEDSFRLPFSTSYRGLEHFPLFPSKCGRVGFLWSGVE